MADGLPEGFELEGGGQTAPAPLRPVQLAPIPAPAPPRLLPSLQTQPGMTASAPPVDAFMQGQPEPGNGLPPGFELEPPVRQLNPVAGAAGSFANAIPVLGQAPTYIHAGLGAAKSYISPDETSPTQGGFFNRAGQILERDRREQEAFEQKHPIVSMVASAGGIGATAAGGVGLLRAAPVVGGRLLGMVGGGPVKQALASAASGAAIGGADLALRGGDPMTGALTGAVIGAPAPAIGRAIGGIAGKIAASRAANNPALQMQAENVAERVVGSPHPTGARLTENGRLTAEAQQLAARNKYEAIDNQGVTIDPRTVSSAIGDIETDLRKANFWPKYDRPIYDLIGKLRDPFHPNVRFGEIQANMQAIKAGVGSGSINPAAGRIALKGLEDFLDNLPKSPGLISGDPIKAISLLQSANKDYHAFKLTDLLETAARDAERQAATGGKGTNISNAYRQKLRPILKKIEDGELRVPPEVHKAIRNAVQGGTYGLRALSAFAPTGIVSLGADVLLGHGIGVPAMALAAAGHVARKSEERLVTNRAQRAVEAAMNMSPAQRQFGALNPIPMAAAASRLGRFGSAAPGLSAIRARSIIGPIDEREADAQYNY